MAKTNKQKKTKKTKKTTTKKNNNQLVIGLKPFEEEFSKTLPQNHLKTTSSKMKKELAILHDKGIKTESSRDYYRRCFARMDTGVVNEEKL